MPQRILIDRRWRLGLIAATIVAVVTSIPQLNLMIKQGSSWQGSYALMDFDELVYSGYLNAVINGRPRRNNPHLATQSDQHDSGESFFSIQFLPAFVVALPARALGISASTAFILLTPLMAFVSSLAIFWLLLQITRNESTAALGTLFVLFCGRLVSESPFVSAQYYSSFAFLRRYVPAVPFPLFFLFCGFVWHSFVEKSKAWALSAGLMLALLMYSYFYLWTAAAAFLVCLTILWLVAYRDNWRVIAKSILVLATIALAGLLPYLYLLSLRAKTLDEDQALTFSRMPDFFRVPELLGFTLLLVLTVYVRRGRINWRSPEVLFATACAATPFVVFNQQVLTAVSLQSFHYEQFIINYVVLVGLVLTYHLVWSHLRIRPVIWAIFAVCIGLATALKEAHDNSALNVRRDQARPVFERLQQSNVYGFALFNNSLLAASAVTDSSLPQLWTPNMHFYGGVSSAERVERFYQYLYLLGVEPQTFAHDLETNPQVRAAVFGLRRVNTALTRIFTPVSAEEIRMQVESYSAYVHNFSSQQASRWPLAYVVTIGDGSYDFTNLDRWYTRGSAEAVGDCVIYTVHLKSQP
jgi:hypothetical protein